MGWDSAASNYGGCAGGGNPPPNVWSCYNTADESFGEYADDCSDGGLICFIFCFCPYTTNWMYVEGTNYQWPLKVPYCLENGYNPSDCWGLSGQWSGYSLPVIMDLAHAYIQDHAYQGRGVDGLCECGYKSGKFPTWGWPKLSDFGCGEDVITE